MNCLISIIVPVYNAEKYLSDCIESIISQSYTNIELLLIDDGSTDRSGLICDEYCLKDHRVRVWHNQNHGPSYSRNFGIMKMSGEYLLFVDSDDELEQNALSCIEGSLVSYPDADVLLFGERIEKEKESYNVLPPAGFFTRQEFGDLYLELYRLFLINSPWNKVYKRALVNGSAFPEDMSLGEDLIFCNSYLRRCESFLLLDKPLYTYKMRESDSLTTKFYSGVFDWYVQHYQDVVCTMQQFDPAWERTASESLYTMYGHYIKQAINMTGGSANKEPLGLIIKEIHTICSHPLTRECLPYMECNKVYSILVERKMSFAIIVYIRLSQMKHLLVRSLQKKGC